MDEIREENWREVFEEVEDKEDIHALRWEVYVKEEEELIKRNSSVSVPHLKEGYVFGFV